MSDRKIVCNNGGKDHEHSSLTDFVGCVGRSDSDLYVMVRPRTVAPTAAPAGPASVPAGGVSIRRPTDPPSPRQLEFIGTLGGSWRDVKKDNNKGEASALIEMLKDPNTRGPFQLPIHLPIDDDEWLAFPQELAWRRGELDITWETPTGPKIDDPKPVSPAPYTEPDKPMIRSKSRLETMLPLLERVPDGYYAPLLDENQKLHFFRISRPKSGTYRNCIKIQKLIGPNLETVWVKWPLGNISVYTDWEDHILGIITDYSGAARRYAREIDRCCRCNTRLTDATSRKYGIGPECVKHWPWIIEEVDLELAAGGK